MSSVRKQNDIDHCLYMDFLYSVGLTLIIRKAFRKGNCKVEEGMPVLGNRAFAIFASKLKR
ncbi:hypothetical protein C1N53_10790 [Pontibacter sp. SGAir0037]|nr:hypothetical protein C1N53_10790 [Pontibacter sp. SGAir0037]